MISTARDPTTDTAPPVSRLRTWTALVLLALTFGLVQLDATIVTVAVPAIRADLSGGLALGQWLVDAYVIPFAAGMLAAGAIGDRLGHRRTCAVGCTVFAAASLVAALSTSWALLLTARIVQGLGAAIMLPASLAIIGVLFPAPRERARALGVWGGIATTGFALGPVAGGLFATHAGWPLIFWINVPLGLLLATGITATVPAGTRRSQRLDRWGTVLASIVLAAATGAVIAAGGRLWLGTLALLALAAVSGLGLRAVERRAGAPLLPRGLVGPGTFRITLATGFAFNFVLYGVLFVVTTVLTSQFGADVLHAGLAALPMALVVLFGATTSGFLAARIGPRRPMLAGFGLAAIGSLLLVPAWTTHSTALVVVATAVVGGLSLAMPAMTSVALGSAPVEHAGTAAGALNSARQLGGAIGVAALGALLNAGAGSWGFVVAAVVAAAMCGVGARTSVLSTAHQDRAGAGQGRFGSGRMDP